MSAFRNLSTTSPSQCSGHGEESNSSRSIPQTSTMKRVHDICVAQPVEDPMHSANRPCESSKCGSRPRRILARRSTTRTRGMRPEPGPATTDVLTIAGSRAVLCSTPGTRTKAPGGQPGAPGLNFLASSFCRQAAVCTRSSTEPAPKPTIGTGIRFPNNSRCLANPNTLFPRRYSCGSRDAVADEVNRVGFQLRVRDMSGVDVNVW